jgi:phenylalanine-4-hydroxylase
LYNHEPDFIHEVFGHQATLMIPECNQVLQKLGLASLGASQQELEKLAAAYWYTFEVGLCLNQKGDRKILGGAVLSSIEESQVAMSNHLAASSLIKLDLELITNQNYRQSIQYSGLQLFYVLSPQLEELCSMLDTWLNGFLQRRPFRVEYCEKNRSLLVTETLLTRSQEEPSHE